MNDEMSSGTTSLSSGTSKVSSGTTDLSTGTPKVQKVVQKDPFVNPNGKKKTNWGSTRGPKTSKKWSKNQGYLIPLPVVVQKGRKCDTTRIFWEPKWPNKMPWDLKKMQKNVKVELL